MKLLKDNPPAMIRSSEQLDYYHKIIDDCIANDVPLKTSDRHSLGAFAINLALIDMCAESIENEGMHVSVNGHGAHDVTKANPAVNLQKDAQTALRYYFKEFQMTPNSRGSASQVSLAPKGDGGDVLSKI